MLTQERLKEVLYYNPVTGLFTWIKKTSIMSKVSIGDLAGWANGGGYLNIKIDGKSYKSHRLAWLYTYGSFPKSDLDHKNRNQTDNRINNLRLCTYSENGANRSVQSNNSSGYKNVYWYKRGNKWKAQIRSKNERIHLGYFDCKHEAARAYNQKALELHGEFAYLNEVNHP